MDDPHPRFDDAARRAWRPVEQQISVSALRQRGQRLRARSWLIVQAAGGAALAWWLAHSVLGHPMPFFAPITAMVCLGLTYDNRVRRVLELAVGVAIGVFTGDLFVQVFGTGIWQIAAVCTLAMTLAVLLGAGSLLMMQAGIQGVIITTLVVGDGEAFGRWLDAVVGGTVALGIAMLAPATSTTRRPRERSVRLIGHLAEILTDTANGLSARDSGRTDRALARSRELQNELDDLRDSAAEAMAAARLAPLRRRHRSGVQEIRAILDPLDLAIRNVRVLVRRADVAVMDHEFVPGTYTDMVTGLAGAAASIAEELAAGRSTDHAREDLVNLARSSTWSHPRARLSAEVMRAQVRSTVVDLLMLTGMTLDEARARVPPTADDLDPPEPSRDG